MLSKRERLAKNYANSVSLEALHLAALIKTEKKLNFGSEQDIAATLAGINLILLKRDLEHSELSESIRTKVFDIAIDQISTQVLRRTYYFTKSKQVVKGRLDDILEPMYREFNTVIKSRLFQDTVDELTRYNFMRYVAKTISPTDERSSRSIAGSASNDMILISYDTKLFTAGKELIAEEKAILKANYSGAIWMMLFGIIVLSASTIAALSPLKPAIISIGLVSIALAGVQGLRKLKQEISYNRSSRIAENDALVIKKMFDHLLRGNNQQDEALFKKLCQLVFQDKKYADTALNFAKSQAENHNERLSIKRVAFSIIVGRMYLLNNVEPTQDQKLIAFAAVKKIIGW